MRRLLTLFLIFLVSCTVAAAPSPPMAASAPTQDVAELISKTVALVGDGGAYCSGVWVSEGTIVTANHCVSDLNIGDAVRYVVHDDVFAPGELETRDTIHSRTSALYATDKDHDLALLYAGGAPAHRVAKVSMEPVRAGQHVNVMGMPLGTWFCYSSGDVASVHYEVSHGMKILFIQATAPISGGNSGGGLFNDFGELLGITHAQYTNGQNMNLFIHYQYVHDLLVKSGF